MGFQRPQYKLIFDGNFQGLEVVTKGGTLGEVARFAAILSMGEALITSDAEVERKELLEILGSKLISWNLTDDNDEPVPATAAQLAQEDIVMVTAIASGWMRRGSGVSDPLDGRSNGGVPSEVESIPMEIL